MLAFASSEAKEKGCDQGRERIARPIAVVVGCIKKKK